MISDLTNTETGLTEIDEPVNGCWIRMQDPTQREILEITELRHPPGFYNAGAGY